MMPSYRIILFLSLAVLVAIPGSQAMPDYGDPQDIAVAAGSALSAVRGCHHEQVAVFLGAGFTSVRRLHSGNAQRFSFFFRESESSNCVLRC